jgi:uncharacterized protein
VTPSRGEVLGSVALLSTTAVKGFGLRHPRQLRLTAAGADGDRGFLVADEGDHCLSVTASAAFLPFWAELVPDGPLRFGRGDEVVLAAEPAPGAAVRVHLFGERYVDGHEVTGPWAEFLSDLAGQPVRLVRAADPAHDVHPVTMVSRASVAALGTEQDGSPLDVRRFRMLVTLDGPDAFGEDDWRGTRVEVGSATLEVGGPVPRCAAVQRHPESPERDQNALRMINDVRGPQLGEMGRGLHLGTYAEVVAPGTVAVGDPVVAGG